MNFLKKFVNNLNEKLKKINTKHEKKINSTSNLKFLVSCTNNFTNKPINIINIKLCTKIKTFLKVV